jgi:hypothetical protein
VRLQHNKKPTDHSSLAGGLPCPQHYKATLQAGEVASQQFATSVLRASEYPVALGQRALVYLKSSEVHESINELDEARTALDKGRTAALEALCLAKNEAEF